MIEFSNQAKLGYGIYTIPEIATLLRLPVSKVRYWLKEFWDAKLNAEKYSWGDQRDKVVNFYTLIEFYIFYQLRTHRISSVRILKAHQLLSRTFATPYPFASYKIMTDGKSILFSPDGEDIVNASPDSQYNIKGIIEEFVKKIDFQEHTQMAVRFFPAGKNNSIVVDPHHQFGQPVIRGTNILAEMLYSMHKHGEDTDFIASIYGLKNTEVEDAITFFQKAA